MQLFKISRASRSAAALVFVVAALLQGCMSQQFFQNAAHRAAAHSQRNPAPSEKAAFANLRSLTLLAAKNAKPGPKQKSMLLRDISEGGATGGLVQELQPGAKVHVRFEGGILVPAVVKWTDDGLVGLAFIESILLDRSSQLNN